jgi:hypothetical protein
MKFSNWLIGTLVLTATVLRPTIASAVMLGQTDTFENGTTQNWLVGLLGAPHPAPPQNISTGGPAGTDDNYMLLTAIGGSGPGSKLAVINLAQWAGDYLAEGISAISMDLKNLGTTDLSLRLLLADPMGGPPTNLAFSTDPILLPAGSDWESVIFPIRLTDLTAGLGDATKALTNATELRIFHSPTATFPGPPVQTQLGVDNITATSVPEPSTAIMSGLGMLALLVSKRRIVR